MMVIMGGVCRCSFALIAQELPRAIGMLCCPHSAALLREDLSNGGSHGPANSRCSEDMRLVRIVGHVVREIITFVSQRPRCSCLVPPRGGQTSPLPPGVERAPETRSFARFTTRARKRRHFLSSSGSRAIPLTPRR